MTALPTHVREIQIRDPFGRFASHGTDAVKVTNHPTRSLHGAAVIGHGKAALAPTQTSRSRTRPPNSNSPNGAAVGRRLP